jgi:hypothetical protein
MDDNGMQRYFDANDDEAWDWYAISFSSEYRETFNPNFALLSEENKFFLSLLLDKLRCMNTNSPLE